MPQVDDDRAWYEQQCREIVNECLGERRMVLADVIMDELMAHGRIPKNYIVSLEKNNFCSQSHQSSSV